MSWLGMGLPERPEAPPSYAVVRKSKAEQSGRPAVREDLNGPLSPTFTSSASSLLLCTLSKHRRIDPNPEHARRTEERRLTP
ncbi:hypothetical protein KUCAC02_028367, partial [Chaenocephalus aceratus]